MLSLPPLLASLLHRRGTTLIMLCQIAIALAIASNTFLSISTSIALMNRDTGFPEDEIFSIRNSFPNKDNKEITQQRRADLAMLRALDGVKAATLISSLPISWGGLAMTLQNGDRKQDTGLFFADQAALDALGLELVAGRNFTAQEVRWLEDNEPPRVTIITQSLAQKLFPGEEALGKTIHPYEQPDKPIRVIGVVKKMQGEHLLWDNALDNAIFPHVLPGHIGYIVRTSAAQRDALMTYIEDRLMQLEPDRRLFSQSFEQAMAIQYQPQNNSVLFLSIINAALFIITAIAIFGVTSHSVAQRRRDIGTRRALGATRQEILKYFFAENSLVVLLGGSLGVLLAFILNGWLVREFSLAPLAWQYLLLSVIGLWLIGQLAVLYPALQAAKISPVVATRRV